MKYGLGIKRSHVVAHATAWVNPENILLMKEARCKGHILMIPYLLRPESANLWKQKVD